MPRNVRVSISASGDEELLIARILGNDLYPRHDAEQTLCNLEFILNEEGPLPNARKLFIVNRIFDKDKERKVIELLEQAGQDYVQVPFVAEDYARLCWDPTPFGGLDYFTSTDFKKLNEYAATRARIFAAAPKIRYAMNVNGARNLALELGRQTSRWTLPLDGNCIFTAEAFQRLCNHARVQPSPLCLVLPFRRLQRNEQFYHPVADTNVPEEPQLALHRDAEVRFDERYPYGIRDKAELLIRLEVPGPWNEWDTPPWLPVPLPAPPSPDAFRLTDAVVLRLASGKNGLEHPKAQKQRYRARNQSILTTIRLLDDATRALDRDLGRIILGSEELPNRKKRSWLKRRQ